MVQVSSNLRSTAKITDFVNLSDEAKTLAVRLKAIQTELAQIQAEVLEQIGEGRAVKVGSQVRTLRPAAIESIERTCDDETAVDYCKTRGLKYQERSAEYVAPATFSAHVKAGLMSAELYVTEKTQSIVVT